MYQFNISLNDDDYYEFNKQHMFNLPGGKKHLLIYRLIMPVICVVFLLLDYMRKDYYITSIYIIYFKFIVYTVVSVVWFFVSKPILQYTLRRRIKAIKKRGKMPYNRRAFMRFDNEYFTEITDQSETKTKYSSIEKIIFGKNAVYLYTSVVQAYIVADTVFEKPEQKTEFCEFIRQRAAQAKDSQEL